MAGDFDFDIYGDEGLDSRRVSATLLDPEQQRNGIQDAHIKKEDDEESLDVKIDGELVKTETSPSTNGPQLHPHPIPQFPPITNGVQQFPPLQPDSRPVDPHATTALLINDLQWFENEEDIRALCPHLDPELKDVTFSEHKVNGKSKGTVYIEFTTPQAATAMKYKIDANLQQQLSKWNCIFTNSFSNPFRTLPKEQGRAGGNQPMRGVVNPAFRGGMNRGGMVRGGMPGFRPQQMITPGFRPPIMNPNFRNNMRGGMNHFRGAFNPAFNPGYFPNQQMGMPQQGFDNWGYPQGDMGNPHGMKRARE